MGRVFFNFIMALGLVLGSAWHAHAQTEEAKDFPRLLVERECLDCDFSGLPLQRQSLLGIVAQRGDFTGANLSGADLRRADLRGAILRDVNFTGANLSSARWDAADLSGAIFCNTILPDRSVSTAECIEGTWKSSFDGIAGGVLQIRPSGKPGYWEGVADGQVALRDIHRKGEGKYNAEIYLEIGDDTYMQKGWFPIGCKIDAGNMVCGKNGILTFEQLSADVSIAKAVQFKLPEEPKYSIFVYMLEFDRTNADGSKQQFLQKVIKVFTGTKRELNFNSATISGRAYWKVKGYSRAPAFGHPIKAALYKGTSKNLRAEFIRKVEGETDNKGNFTLTLPIQRFGDVAEKEIRNRGLTRKCIYTKPQNTALAFNVPGATDNTLINAALEYEAKRSDLDTWFHGNETQTYYKNKKAGLTKINALGSLIRVITAKATAKAQLVENGFKLIEWVTGEPIPGTKKPSAEEKAKGELRRQQIWEKFDLFFQAQGQKLLVHDQSENAPVADSLK